MKIAVVGAGISGLCCARWLSDAHQVTLFEAGKRLGGHTHTVRVNLDDGDYDVDTGFIVYNDLNYPRFSALLRDLNITTQPSEMSFSVSQECNDFEFRGNGLGLFAQPQNLIDPTFAQLLRDILRFNRDARKLIESGIPDPNITLEALLRKGHYSPRLAEHYLIPLGSAIWSADPESFASMPAMTFAKFLDNHGWLRIRGRPTWRTVTGGAARYVDALSKSLSDVRRQTPVTKVVRNSDTATILTDEGLESFDAVVLAVHSDEALALLGDPSRGEEEILGAISYRPNIATLHTDSRMLPHRRRAWAAWNAYLPTSAASKPTVTYWMNRLQRIDSKHQICVTLNRENEINPEHVLGQWTYRHPVFDGSAIAAQANRNKIQGQRRTWYCGAYWGYGFHEDGVSSAVDVCRSLGVDLDS
jgi:predicted NAD/FAD-binding protein